MARTCPAASGSLEHTSSVSACASEKLSLRASMPLRACSRRQARIVRIRALRATSVIRFDREGGIFRDVTGAALPSWPGRRGRSAKRMVTCSTQGSFTCALMSAKRTGRKRKTYSAASRIGDCSGGASIWRGRPISTGWNSTAAAIVQSSDSAINLPMLDMPG